MNKLLTEGEVYEIAGEYEPVTDEAKTDPALVAAIHEGFDNAIQSFMNGTDPMEWTEDNLRQYIEAWADAE